MTCEWAREQIPSYVLGALGPRERARVEAHLTRCPECTRELQGSLDASSHLAASVPQVDPPPGLKEGLFDHIRQEAQWETRLTPLRPLLSWRGGLATAAALLLVALGAVTLTMRQEMDDMKAQTQDLQKMVQNQPQRLVVSPESARQQYDLVNMLARTDKHIYWAERSSNVRGMMLTSANGRWGILTTVGLEILPPDKEYQVWLQRDDQVSTEGTFNVDESGWGQLTLRPAQSMLDLQSIVVTVEPRGGSPQPTTPHVFRANMTEDK